MTSVVPIDQFKWSHSLRFNNTAAFDWRLVSDGRKAQVEVSDHAFGTAIDINPLINPWVREGLPSRLYDPRVRGSLHSDSHVVTIFRWEWGGNEKKWKSSKDWQHFYRAEIPLNEYGKIEVVE